MLEALCRQSSTTLDIVHAEDGPPITQRTSGLEEARLEGDQDALFVHLLELWQMNFTLEIKRQRRKSAQTSENRRGRRL